MPICPWSAYTPATISFCEARLCDWVVEPSNAWSNLGFIFLGILILLRSQRRTTQLLIGVVSVLIGIGSFGLHATATRWGEIIDLAGMYFMSGLGVMFAARRVWGWSSPMLVLGYVALNAASLGLMIVLHNNGIGMFAAQLTVAVFTEIYLYAKGKRFPSYRPYQGMIASFALAFFIWNLDKWNVACWPNNHLVTGHAIWHVLCAFSVYFFSRQQAQLAE